MLVASLLLFPLAFGTRGLPPARGATGHLLLPLAGVPWLLDVGVPQQKAGGWTLVIIAVSPSCRPPGAPRGYSPIHLRADIFITADGKLPGRLAASLHQPITRPALGYVWA